MNKFVASVALGIASATCLLIGCKPASDTNSNAQKSAAPTSSDVPLRLWIVSRVSDASMVQRAWLTSSDQPIEVRALSVEEYLAEPTCACDVVLYPSRLIGELVDRKWLAKLPASLSSTEEEALNVLPALARQATYGKAAWGISLGATVPVVIVSPPAAATVPEATDWESVLAGLKPTEAKETQLNFDPKSVDRAALVDRFLAIAGGLTSRSPDYGILFELQTMRPRLSEPEFTRAAEILQQIGHQGSSNASAETSPVLADDSKAWQWIHANPSYALAVIAPQSINGEAATATGGKALRIPSKWIGWNTGGGMIASLSANCRQSARAADLMRWMRSVETRQLLAPIVTGVESVTPQVGSDSTAWQAASIANEMLAGNSIPSELRLARAEEYRGALADALIAILAGEKAIPAALSDATAAWEKITETRGRVLQRSDYEVSLGLIGN